MGKKGGGSSPQTTTQTTTSQPPPYIAAAYKNVLNEAGDVYDLPLQQFGGAQLAGFTPLQEQAFSDIQGARGSWSPYIDRASNLIDTAGQDIWSQLPEYGGDTLQRYLNPYQDEVINTTIDDLVRLNAQERQAGIGNAVASSAWGGSGAEDMLTNLAGEQSRRGAGIIAGLRQQGYESAADKFMQDRASQLQSLATSGGLQLQGAGTYGGIAAQELQNRLAQSEAQLGAGTQQQNLVQQQLNIPFEQFLQQQAFPYESLQYYANITSQIGGGAGGTTTGTGTAPGQQRSNTFGNILGAAGTVASLFLKDGGRVRGGIAPSIMTQGRSTIPAGGIVPARLSAPAPTPLPSSTAPGISASYSPSFVDLSGMGVDGVRSLGTPDQTWDWTDWFSPGAVADKAIADAGEFGPYRFQKGGRVPGYKYGGGIAGYQDGGDVKEYNPSGNAALAAALNGPVADPVQGFKPVVRGTPVYAFNPLHARAQAVDIPSRLPVKDTTKKAEPASQINKSLAFGPDGRIYDLSDASGWVNQYAQRNRIDPRTTELSTAAALFNRGDYDRARMLGFSPLHTPEDFRKGGRVKCYNRGGRAKGIMGYQRGGPTLPLDPRHPRSLPMTPRQDIPAGIAPSILQNKGGISYIPQTRPQRGGFSAPGLVTPRENITTLDPAELGKRLSAITKGIAGAPAADPNRDISGLALGDRLERMAGDPGRAALFYGGASMMGVPTEDPWQAIGHGLIAGGTAYSTTKSSQNDARKEAQKLHMEALKFQKEMEIKDKELQLKEQELGQSEFSTVEGEDEIYILDKKTGDVRPTGKKPKSDNDFSTIAGEDDIYVLDKTTGKLKGTGKKPKSSGASTLDINPNDIQAIETQALSLIPGALSSDGTQIRPDVYEALGPDLMKARQAASAAYQKTRNSQDGISAFLQALGINPGTDIYEPPSGQWNPFKENRPGEITVNQDAALKEARDAIKRGAPAAKVKERLKGMGIDPGEL